MLSRDYGRVGSKGSVIREWGTEGSVGRLKSVGNDLGGGITITDAQDHNVQTCGVEGNRRGQALGAKGRSLGEFRQPCQTALSWDGAALAVADSGNNRIQLFNATTRKLLTSVGKRGQIRPGRMEGPEGVAFVAGRREMIVADSGNNRLQVFHVEQLPKLPDAPAVVATTASKSSRTGRPSSSDEFMANGTIDSWRLSSGSGSLSAWEISQQPPPLSTTSESRLGRRHGAGELPKYDPQVDQAASLPPIEGSADGFSEACLVIFGGGEDAGSLRKRRTAGESEEGEGPLSQPCDVAFWKAARKGTGCSGGVCAWNPSIPPWFCRRTGTIAGCSESSSEESEEARLRAELLLPPRPPGSIPPKQETTVAAELGKNNKSARLSADIQRRQVGNKERKEGESSSGDDDEDRGEDEPEAGTFAVRETRVSGEFQLLYVAMTKDAEDSQATGQIQEVESNFVSALSQQEHGEESDGSNWMKRMGRSEPSTSVEKEQGGRDDDSALTPSPSQSSAIFEVRNEVISVLGGREGVEVAGRTYGSLLQLLRAYRGRGFTRLKGVSDTRGTRGLVAVAERGKGRVRLLHYAPGLPPFYPTELTHFHSIEGLQRPTSVSFSAEGDLLVVDEGARKVVVYACLSSSWVPVREFGPGTIAATITPTDRKCGYQRVDFTGDQNQTENFEFPSILVEKSKEGGSGELKANHQDMGVGTPKTGDEKVEARGAGDRMQEGIEWGTGVPVSARFLRLKRISSGGEDPTVACLDRSESIRIVIATSDGFVRALAGPEKKHCGNFIALHEDTVLSIVELLGYRPSEVLTYVNRTMAGIRAKVRREWRLHPLTPGYLARVKLGFLQWGRLITGEGLPGRDITVDSNGLKLCNNFLVKSACSRPACPYSHEQPCIDLGSVVDEGACIVFRGGVTHAIAALYGQIFTWEWEGDLFRLFRDRSSPRALVCRRDPMTLGRYGTEVIRDCVEEVHHVLDYRGFVDFATVLHEHIIGLRSWHRQLSASTPPGVSKETLAANNGAGLIPLGGLGDNSQSIRRTQDNGTGHISCLSRTGGEAILPPVAQQSSQIDANKAWIAGGPVEEGNVTAGTGKGERAGGITDKKRRPTGNKPEMESTTMLDSPGTNCGSPGFSGVRKERRTLVSSAGSWLLEGNLTPWIGWDVATRGLEETSDVAKEEGVIFSDKDDIKANEEKGRKDGDEEPVTNRTYGATADERATSINKLIAFQTDRVVRILDNIF